MGAGRTKWESLTQHSAVVEFFADLFERAGIRVTDTGEEFTCSHLGDRIEFRAQIEPGSVDYVVEITMAQVDRLAVHAETGQLDEDEKYRVAATLFTPATAATLANPVLSHPLLRRLAGAEDVIHVELAAPAAHLESARHTLIYANRQWLVFPGLHGRAARVYRLGLDEALDYHRRSFRALKENRFLSWLRFARWYRSWRRTVSERTA